MPVKMPLIVDPPWGARRLLARRRLVPRDVADEGGDGRVDGFVLPAGSDAGHEDVVDDPVGVDVRDLALEAVADLDADLAVLGEDEEDKPVVEALASDLPGFEGLDRPLLEDGVLAERPADPDEELVAGLALVVLQARVEGLDGRPGQKAGLVGGPSAGGRRDLGLGRGERRSPSAPAKARRASRRRSPVKKLTIGCSDRCLELDLGGGFRARPGP